jgi:tetratricopeptide (TPR) repeat protein
VDNPDQQQRDFFVSYTQADRAWAEWLAWELEAAGYTTLLQAWDMPAGTAFVHAMDQAVQTTRHVVLVLSPAYLRSQMAEAEWRPGFKADPSGKARLLLPVRVEACQPEGLLADRVWIDLVGLDEATAQARLREEIARALRGPGRPTTPPRFPRVPRTPAAATTRPRFPTALPPVWNIPFQRNPTFTGRQQELAALGAALTPGGTAAVTQVLQGAGGVGKTTLAVEYAYRHRSRFDTIWWVRAEQPATLVSDLAELGAALGLAEAGQPDQQVTVAAVRRWLADHDRWLLVLDNAGAPEGPTGLRAPLGRLVDLLPQVVHGQVLVTSRDARWEHHATLAELEVFSPQEAVAFLLARSGSSDQATATETAELLGFLPLALEQAGAYVRETQISLGAYQARLQQSPGTLLRRGAPRDRDPADTVATTWQLSLEQVAAVPGATALLELCAFLAPDDIPRALLEGLGGLAELPDGLAVLAEDALAQDEAVGGLRRFGLLKASPEVVAVHRLVQAVVRQNLAPDAQQRWAGAAVRLVLAAFPDDSDSDEVHAWPRYARLLPHALAATGHASSVAADPEVTARLLNRAGSYPWGRVELWQRRQLLERSLAIREACLGPDHLDVAQSLNDLGGVLRELGELPAARDVYRRALAIREARLGPDHLDVADSVAGLGLVVGNLGDLPAARKAHERALAIREAHLGPDHPRVAQSLSPLGNVLRELGDLPAARKVLERALAIREARHGPDDPRVAGSLANLGFVLHDLGELPAARDTHQRALAIRETRLGPAHRDTAYSLTNLGAVLRELGDLEHARPLLEQALAVFEARLGPDNPDVAMGLDNLGLLLADLGELAAARDAFVRSLSICKTRLGADHPDTARSLSNLALVLRAQSDLDGARGLLERALSIREARRGPDHPDTARTLNNLADLLRAQGDLNRARNLLERALAIRERRLGADHPDTARSRQDLAAVVAALDKQQ